MIHNNKLSSENDEKQKKIIKSKQIKKQIILESDVSSNSKSNSDSEEEVKPKKCK